MPTEEINTPDLRLPHYRRIKKRSEFLSIEKSSKRVFSKHFIVAIQPASSGHSRLGLVVTRKLDKRAVVRNRLKRQLKEVFRLNRIRLTDNFDIVIIARKNANAIDFAQINREVLGALFHNGYLKK